MLYNLIELRPGLGTWQFSRVVAHFLPRELAETIRTSCQAKQRRWLPGRRYVLYEEHAHTRCSVLELRRAWRIWHYTRLVIPLLPYGIVSNGQRNWQRKNRWWRPRRYIIQKSETDFHL